MKALDSWARQFGYADFDTFVRTGGNILDAVRDIKQRMNTLQLALNQLERSAPVIEPERTRIMPAINPETNQADDEPPDPENAQIQGAEHES